MALAFVLAGFCAIAAALSAAPARAAIRHAYQPALSNTITEKLVGNAESTTVDSGHMWVTGREREGNRRARIQEFDASTGALLATFPEVSWMEENSKGLAVGHAAGEELIYATNRDSAIEGEGVIAVFDEVGALKATWKGEKTPLKVFGFDARYGYGVSGVAADESGAPGDWATGDVYVADGNEGAVDLMKPEVNGQEGELVAQLTGPEPGAKFEFPESISGGDYLAVDQRNGDLAVIDERKRVYVFEPEPGLKGTYKLLFEITGTAEGAFIPGRVNAVAFDASNGEIYVSENEGAAPEVYEFGSAGSYIGRLAGLGTSLLHSITVDPEAPGDVYVGSGEERSPNMLVYGPDVVVPDVAVTEPPLKLSPTGVTLRGTVNPDEAGEASCEFEYGTTTEYGQHAKCKSTVPNGSKPVAVESEPIAGLVEDTTYHYRLAATNPSKLTNDEGPEDLGEFTTSGPGLLRSSSSDVSDESATLDATIDPHGASTSYYFQYVDQAGYDPSAADPYAAGAQAPAAPGTAIGSGETALNVGFHIDGLSASTVYDYRVVAVSELLLEVEPGRFETQTQTFYGPDRTFTTQPHGSSFELPDNRQWELVSPANMHGTYMEPMSEELNAQAASNGNAFAGEANEPTEAQAAGNANGVQVLSVRGADGWVSKDISTPHTHYPSLKVGHGTEYRFFSEDLSRAIVQPFGEFTPLSPEASEDTAYLRSDFPTGDPTNLCAESCYRPLVSAANVPTGTQFAVDSSDQKCEENEYICGPYFVDATPNGEHIVLESAAQLTETPTEGQDKLYEWSEGRLEPFAALPKDEGGAVVNAGVPGPIEHRLSDDGSVFFGDQGHIYVDNPETKETYRLHAVHGDEDEGGQSFLYASANGSTMLFSDSTPLTGGTEGGVYECQLEREPEGLTCAHLTLTGLSFAGTLIGGSEDAMYLYFVGANDNLYVDHHEKSGWTQTPIATLSPLDQSDWRTSELHHMTARVSPNGRYLAFMSERSLTGYDNTDAVSGQPDEEVFLYQAASTPSEAGKLVCASCNPTGARPVGEERGEGEQMHLVDGVGVWSSNRWLAALVPPWTPVDLSEARYQSRYLSNSGRLFFDSRDPLVPQDVGGNWGVYEYEPPGVGSCTESSSTYRERAEGCQSLISSPTAREESAFLDASESGGDVFFLTSEKLVEGDLNSTVHVYDAHECTPSAPCFPNVSASPPPCETGEACKTAPNVQPTVFGAPPSATFSGAGDLTSPPSKPATKLTRKQKLRNALKACAKKRRRKRAKCEARARRRYGGTAQKAAEHGKTRKSKRTGR